MPFEMTADEASRELRQLRERHRVFPRVLDRDGCRHTLSLLLINYRHLVAYPAPTDAAVLRPAIKLYTYALQLMEMGGK